MLITKTNETERSDADVSTSATVCSAAEFVRFLARSRSNRPIFVLLPLGIYKYRALTISRVKSYVCFKQIAPINGTTTLLVSNRSFSPNLPVSVVLTSGVS